MSEKLKFKMSNFISCKFIVANSGYKHPDVASACMHKSNPRLRFECVEPLFFSSGFGQGLPGITDQKLLKI